MALYLVDVTGIGLKRRLALGIGVGGWGCKWFAGNGVGGSVLVGNGKGRAVEGL